MTRKEAEELRKTLRRTIQLLNETHGAGVGDRKALLHAIRSLGFAEGAFLDNYVEGSGDFGVRGLPDMLPSDVLQTLIAIIREMGESIPRPDDLHSLAAQLDDQVEESFTVATPGLLANELQIEKPQVVQWFRQLQERVSERITIARTIVNAERALESVQVAEREATRAAERAEESASHVEEVAGGEAVGELAEHFSKYAKREGWTAEVLRVITALLLFGVFAVAYFLFREGDTTTPETLRRLGLAVPLVLFAGYTARESSSHRKVNRWAKSIEVQLRTVKAFTDPLPEDVKNLIRSSFGMHIFATGPDLSDSPQGGASTSDLLKEILGVMRKQADN